MARQRANMVPLMTLGIPGNAFHGLAISCFYYVWLKTPAPSLWRSNPEFFGPLSPVLYIGNVILLIFEPTPCATSLPSYLDVPEALLNGLVLALCGLGVYTRRFSLLDVFLMIIFGIFGYLTRKHNIRQPLCCSDWSWGDMLEQGFRRSFAISNGKSVRFSFTRAHLSGNQ